MVTEALNRRVVRVPDVIGKPIEKAKILLEDTGLKRVVVLFRESYEDRDTVLEQRPGLARARAETSGGSRDRPRVAL